LDFKGIIFDLDMTLVDTSCLEDLRSRRLWNQVYRKVKDTQIYYGISDLIFTLKSSYKIGVVTASPRPYAERVIDYHDLNIPVLSAYHDTKKHKPDPEPILRGITKLGLNAHEVISVGDDDKDIMASNNAGATSVFAGWGNNEMKYISATYNCKTIEEFKKILYKSYQGLVE